MLTALTPTGNRPGSFALLADALNRQTYRGPLHWIVVDDCDPATPVPEMRDGITVEVVRPDWRWHPGMNTQARAMDSGLQRVPPGAWLAILEDDDAYAPEHLEAIREALSGAELVGERVSTYLNLRTRRHRELPGTRHASLSGTGCRRAALALLRQVCARGSHRIDMDLWREFAGPKRLLESRNVVGVKGLPGRGGIGVGHRPDFGSPVSDALIRHLLGDATDGYLALL